MVRVITPDEQEDAKAECSRLFGITVGIEFSHALNVLLGSRIVNVQMVVGKSTDQGHLVLTTQEGHKVTVTSSGDTAGKPPVINVKYAR